MALNYDETDEFDETDDFDEESQEEFLDEEDDNPNTALSQAFREATAGTIEDYDDDEEDEESEEGEEGDDPDDADGADADVNADADVEAEAYAQQLVEPIDPPPDEEDLDDSDDLEDLDVEPPPLKLPSPEVEPFRPQEQSNYAYAEAVTAFYEEKNYQRAIEKFGEAIENESRHAETQIDDPNEIVAKSKYWQAEAYIKLHDSSQAIVTLEDLVETCPGHYLVLAAERRVEALNAKGS
ncbi:hypothetical protein J5I95_22995 [Candidatus Poribacteria bacterium]|nr:hypothetical protein [Candidatus Poribacteria bacterium]